MWYKRHMAIATSGRIRPGAMRCWRILYRNWRRWDMRWQPLVRWIVAMRRAVLVLLRVVPGSLAGRPVLLSSIARVMMLTAWIVAWCAATSSTATAVLASAAATWWEVWMLVWGWRRWWGGV
jgi:hypothetical protein